MNKRKRFFVFLSLLLFGYGQAQEESPETFARDTARVNALIQESKAFYKTDYAKSVDLSNEALKLAVKVKFAKGEGYAIKSIGMANYYAGEPLKALDYFQRSLSVFESIKDNIGIGNLYNNIGVVYYEQGDDSKALENYLLSLRYS